MYLHSLQFTAWVQFPVCVMFLHCPQHQVPTFTAWVQFTLWIPTTPMYLHSLCLFHSLHGLNSLCSPVPYTYIHCVHYIYCVGSIHCVGSPQPVFTVCTAWTPFPVWITFLHLQVVPTTPNVNCNA